MLCDDLFAFGCMHWFNLVALVALVASFVLRRHICCCGSFEAYRIPTMHRSPLEDIDTRVGSNCVDALAPIAKEGPRFKVTPRSILERLSR